jgi:pyridoxine/pyridoxamine 5'-phosphate oxidase
MNRALRFIPIMKAEKGHELEDNPYAAITFLWLELVRQVRIEGTVSRSSDVESETYFQSRPRASQISAYVSEQSRYLNRREELEGRFPASKQFVFGKTHCPTSPLGWLLFEAKLHRVFGKVAPVVCTTEYNTVYRTMVVGRDNACFP